MYFILIIYIHKILYTPYAFDNLEYEGNMMYECKIMILV